MRRMFMAVLVLFAVDRCVAQGLMDTTTIMQMRGPSVPNLLQMPSAYTNDPLGLFCKLDVALERKLKVPLLIRLGDVRQVEAWEGKGSLAPPRKHGADQ